jgi:hypothetical protein
MKRLVSYALMAVIFTACGVANQSGITHLQTPMDGVKLLSASITDPNDPRSMMQNQYPIASNSRLLIRLENLLEKVGEISLIDGDKVTVEITLLNAADAAAAKTSFQVCPVLKNWMMLATWNRAYPMGSDGMWGQVGGDYDTDSCVSTPVVGTNGKDLTFDVTEWFMNYVRGRQINYGLMLFSTSSTPIQIKGDTDGYSAPRISWTYVTNLTP